jgi:hypothetical protein
MWILVRVTDYMLLHNHLTWASWNLPLYLMVVMDRSFKWGWMIYINWISSTRAHSHWTAAVGCVFISSRTQRRCKIIQLPRWRFLSIFRRPLSIFAVTWIFSNMNSLWKTNWLIHSGRRTVYLWYLRLRQPSWVFQIVLAVWSNLLFAVSVLQLSGSSSCICNSSGRRRSRSWAFSWG